MSISPGFLALIPLLASMAHSAVVNIDFGDLDLQGLPSPTFAGLAAAPDPASASAHWNNPSAPSKGLLSADSLLDSSGAVTSIALSLGVSSTFASSGDQELGGSTDGAYTSLMGDYLVLDSGRPDIVKTATGILSGLVPTGSYDLYFYGQGDNFSQSGPSGQNTLFTLGGISKQTRWDGTRHGDGHLFEGIEFVKFTIEADAEGEIVFTWANVVQGVGGNVENDLDGQNSRYAAFNALQIVSTSTVAVPEPAATLLGVLGLLALLRRRRAA